MSWKTKDFVVAGVFAIVTFALAFVLGAGIITATGIPATGGISNIFVAVLVVTIGMKIIPKPGFGTLTVGLLFAFAIPTVIGGPPGAYKVINGILIGLVFDVVAIIGRRSKIAHTLAGALAATTSILSIYMALVWLGLPGADRLLPLLLPLTIFQFVTGALAGWLGTLLYDKRLKALGPVQRIQA